MSNARIIHADCLAALRDMPDASVDAVVTDPPYGLSNTTPAQVAETIARWVTGDREYLPSARGFMGHEWDGFVPPVAVWDECLRVLKPGGHLLAFAGSRTHDLMTLGIRLAGFEIRDSVAWLYGSGFPKSLDVSKAMDRIAGADRGIPRTPSSGGKFGFAGRNINGVADSTWRCEACGRSKGSQPGNCQCDKRGEPQTDAAREWEGWGTALKPAFEPVTLARKPLTGTVAANVLKHGTGALNIDAGRIPGPAWTFKHGPKTGRGGGGIMGKPTAREGVAESSPAGRWPANVVLDEHCAAELDRQAGASRFMYCAKAPKSERPVVDGVAHSTVKPVTLMRWLVRMVTPPGGVVLDPFAGSGTTLEAAMLEGFNVTGIEREADYLPLIQARIDRATTTLAAQAEAEGDTLFPIAHADSPDPCP